MRLISKAEAKQRGCVYCKYVKSSAGILRKEQDKNKYSNRACPHDRCPYTVMDEYATYEDYCATLSQRYAEAFS